MTTKPKLVFVTGTTNPACPAYMVLDINPNAFDDREIDGVRAMAYEYMDIFGECPVDIMLVPTGFLSESGEHFERDGDIMTVVLESKKRFCVFVETEETNLCFPVCID